MDLEPQRRTPQKPQIPNTPLTQDRHDEEEEVVEGMTTRDHKSNDFRESPLKVFIGTEVFLLGAGIVLGLLVYFFFRAV